MLLRRGRKRQAKREHAGRHALHGFQKQIRNCLAWISPVERKLDALHKCLGVKFCADDLVGAIALYVHAVVTDKRDMLPGAFFFNFVAQLLRTLHFDVGFDIDQDQVIVFPGDLLSRLLRVERIAGVDRRVDFKSMHAKDLVT